MCIWSLWPSLSLSSSFIHNVCMRIIFTCKHRTSAIIIETWRTLKNDCRCVYATCLQCTGYNDSAGHIFCGLGLAFCLSFVVNRFFLSSCLLPIHFYLQPIKASACAWRCVGWHPFHISQTRSHNSFASSKRMVLKIAQNFNFATKQHCSPDLSCWWVSIFFFTFCSFTISPSLSYIYWLFLLISILFEHDISIHWRLRKILPFAGAHGGPSEPQFQNDLSWL